jgi:hypothetical protein
MSTQKGPRKADTYRAARREAWKETRRRVTRDLRVAAEAKGEAIPGESRLPRSELTWTQFGRGW